MVTGMDDEGQQIADLNHSVEPEVQDNAATKSSQAPLFMEAESEIALHNTGRSNDDMELRQIIQNQNKLVFLKELESKVKVQYRDFCSTGLQINNDIRNTIVPDSSRK